MASFQRKRAEQVLTEWQFASELFDPWRWERDQVSMWGSSGGRTLLLKVGGVLKKIASYEPENKSPEVEM